MGRAGVVAQKGSAANEGTGEIRQGRMEQDTMAVGGQAGGEARQGVLFGFTSDEEEREVSFSDELVEEIGPVGLGPVLGGAAAAWMKGQGGSGRIGIGDG